jgi:hydroxyacylglutathione hydrolase
MLRYLTVPVTPFQQNCSIVWCDATGQAAVIDPGGDLDLLLAEIQRLGLTLSQIWLTHAHIDHAGGTGELAERLQLPIVGPTIRAISSGSMACRSKSAMFGFPPAQHFTPTRWAGRWRHGADRQRDAGRAPLAQVTRRAMWCSTHHRSSAALWGDVLFAGSIGPHRFSPGQPPAVDRQHHAAPVAHGEPDGIHSRPWA